MTARQSTGSARATTAISIDVCLTGNKHKKNQLFRVTETIPMGKSKAQQALNWCNANQHPLTMHLITFVLVEGRFFPFSFCAIFWLKQ